MALSLSDFKKGNWWITFIVIGVVLVLFFIPDLVGFNATLPTPDKNFSLELPKVAQRKTESAPVEDIRVSGRSEPVDAGGAQQAVAGQAPLDRVSYLVDAGYIDHIADKRSREEAKAADEGKAAAGEGDAKTQPQPREDDALDFVPREQVTWSQIQSKKSRRILEGSASRASALARDLPEDKVNARYALQNLAGGIARILGDASKSMSAKEAVYYLEHLDLEVTRAFLKDDVSRADFTSWGEVSLTPILGRSRSERFKKAARPPFDPPAQLFYVEVMRPAARRYEQEAPPVYVQFRGVVEGKDVKRAKLFHDGLFVRDLVLHADAQRKDRFEFGLHQGDARGVYAVKFEDKEGNESVRQYRFARALGTKKNWRFESNNCYVFRAVSTGPSDRSADSFFRYTKVQDDDAAFFASSGQGFSVF